MQQGSLQHTQFTLGQTEDSQGFPIHKEEVFHCINSLSSHWFSPSSASRYLLSITQGTILCLKGSSMMTMTGKTILM